MYIGYSAVRYWSNLDIEFDNLRAAAALNLDEALRDACKEYVGGALATEDDPRAAAGARLGGQRLLDLVERHGKLGPGTKEREE